MSILQNENARESRTDVFDPTRLATLLDLEDDGDASMIKDIAAQFVEDILGVMDRIETALGAGDFARIASAAHTVKGGAATFGLYQVEKIARELEACASRVFADGLRVAAERLCGRARGAGKLPGGAVSFRGRIRFTTTPCG